AALAASNRPMACWKRELSGFKLTDTRPFLANGLRKPSNYIAPRSPAGAAGEPAHQSKAGGAGAHQQRAGAPGACGKTLQFQCRFAWSGLGTVLAEEGKHPKKHHG